ncbi:MAG: hypothetical protein D6732_21250 [Methanobacteriota archaeon]|nr:MAG: hypothetical protein D6732_21250 [Euryarchaeota archaeon]
MNQITLANRVAGPIIFGIGGLGGGLLLTIAISLGIPIILGLIWIVSWILVLLGFLVALPIELIFGDSERIFLLFLLLYWAGIFILEAGLFLIDWSAGTLFAFIGWLGTIPTGLIAVILACTALGAGYGLVKGYGEKKGQPLKGEVAS